MNMFPRKNGLPVKITTDNWHMVRYSKINCKNHLIENENGVFLMMRLNEENEIVESIVGSVDFISEENLWFTIKGWQLSRNFCDDEYLKQLDNPETASEFEFYEVPCEVPWEVPTFFTKNFVIYPAIRALLNDPELYFKNTREKNIKAMLKASRNY